MVPGMTGVHKRFADWVKWLDLSSQDEVAKLIGCSQAMVSHLLPRPKVKGKRRGPRNVKMLDLAARIEAASSNWHEGPIRAIEWAQPSVSSAGKAA